MLRYSFHIGAQFLLLLLVLYGQTNGVAVDVGNPKSFRNTPAQAQGVPVAKDLPPPEVLEEAAELTREEEEDKAFWDCRSLSPPGNETLLPVFVKGKSFMDLSSTLTSVVSVFVPELAIAKDVFLAFKFVASFFGARQNITTVHANYWEILENQVEFMIENRIDASILSATSNAVSRMKGDMETYLEHSKPMKDWSALLLTLKMDTTFNDVLSDFYGVLHKEKSFLQYLDMATARIVLWQTTALRYIQELGIQGQTAWNDVCDIVLMWQSIYEFEMERVKKDLIPAMETWRKNWKSQMQLVCREKCDDYWGWGWNKYIDCFVRDGYNGHNYPTDHYKCTHHSCWNNVCNQFCSTKVSERQSDADATYNYMMTVPNTFLKNMEQVASSEMYGYVNECLARSADGQTSK